VGAVSSPAKRKAKRKVTAPLDLQKLDILPRRSWIRCACGEWWCRTHQAHAFECACPKLYEDEE